MRWGATTVSRKIALLQVLACTAAFLPTLAPELAYAKKGGGDDRFIFYGRVQARPESLSGTWMIGGRTFHADGATEFDQVEGPLHVGSCAKVEVRNGRVHEIDSESPRHCQ